MLHPDPTLSAHAVDRVLVRDRWFAVSACAATAGVIIAGKFAVIGLGLWLLGAILARRGAVVAAETWRIDLASPIIWVLTLAALAMLSATWATKPQLAISAGTHLAVVAIVVFVTLSLLRRVADRALVLVGGWVAIGYCIGVLVLAIEFATDFAMTKAVFLKFPSFFPSQSLLIQSTGDGRASVGPAVANWAVGAMSLLLWPVLLIVRNLSGRLTKRPAQGALALSVLIAAAVSSHQTSMVALAASLSVFLLTKYQRRGTRVLGILAWGMLTLATVPMMKTLVDAYLAQDLVRTNVSRELVTLEDRFPIWRYVMNEIPLRPFLGIGADHSRTYSERHAAQSPPDTPEILAIAHPHSVYLQTWFELGAVGAFILFLIGASVIWQIGRWPVDDRPYAFAAFALTATIASATWNLWASWLLAALGLTLLTFCLARSIPDRSDHAAGRFWDIWLPSRH